MEGLEVQVDAEMLEKERNHFGVIRCKHCTLEWSGFEVTGINKVQLAVITSTGPVLPNSIHILTSLQSSFHFVQLTTSTLRVQSWGL